VRAMPSRTAALLLLSSASLVSAVPVAQNAAARKTQLATAEEAVPMHRRAVCEGEMDKKTHLCKGIMKRWAWPWTPEEIAAYFMPPASPSPPGAPPPPPGAPPPPPGAPPTDGLVVPGTLWGITDASKCAESLPFGPGALTTSSTPKISTDAVTGAHDTWVQKFYNGAAELYTMEWKFSTSKTLAQRFDYAVSTGEPVTWTIRKTGVAPETISGTWRWSDSAGTYSNRFTSSGSKFSNDDGCWAAGTGSVNGNKNAAQGGIKYGHCNMNSGDSVCSKVYQGSQTTTTMPNLKTYLYIGA